jgi:2-C-methyl-D-erythritol 4-phosphate cytidylyltransferase
VVARSEEFDLIRQAALDIPIDLVEGGQTRQESVFNGVCHAKSDMVLVHDAARPCISLEIIRNVIEAAKISGGAIAALPATDTVKRAKANGQIDQTLDRNQIYLAQTPQVFMREPFLEALKEAQLSGYAATDCSSVMEVKNLPVQLVAGDANNLKVTFAADLIRAEAILRERGQL